MDELLRSPEGMHAAELAETWKCDVRTVRRYAAVLDELIGEVVLLQLPTGEYRNKYVPLVLGLFVQTRFDLR